MYLRLDKDLASFLRYLDHTVGEGNYTIFLSADHGAAHNASFLKDHKIPAGTLSENELEKDLKALMKKTFGSDSIIRAVMNYQIVLDENFIEKKKLNRAAIKNTLIKHCQKTEGIAYVIDLEKLSESTIPNYLKEVMANGYYAPRCGTIGIIYQPGWYSDGQKRNHPRHLESLRHTHTAAVVWLWYSARRNFSKDSCNGHSSDNCSLIAYSSTEWLRGQCC